MDPHYPTLSEPATPEYVLAVLQDQHRQSAQFDPEVDPGAVLSFETTIQEWREACDLLDWKTLGRAHNEWWKIDCADDEWESVLVPASEKRLAGVCELIASRASRPSVRAARILGTDCLTAGAFLTIRSLLADAGASPDEIAPSAPLLPFTRRYCRVFLEEISRLAPGALPPVKVRTPVYDAGIWGMAVGWACAVIGLVGSRVWGDLIGLEYAGVLLFLISYVCIWTIARHILPSSVEFGDLKTFRDLAQVIGNSEWR